MGKISLLDCTLRDGGYINDWQFGEECIKNFSKKIALAGVEIVEVGFIKGDTFNPNRSVFPDVESIRSMIEPKVHDLMYVGMLDMSAPIPLERITPCTGESIDGIRVIFKKSKIEEAFVYCKRIKELGYKLFVNFVGTDLYSDEEFIKGIEKFNSIEPYAMSIVDSFGLIKRKHFLRLVYLADNNMLPGIVLCYHAHNNLQQAFGNAEALVEMNLKRDICIDACVFGMGRGAGNLNLELFAEYMNENYNTHYRVEPMLELMDEYLSEIYRNRFWGYSLPLYLSASTGCHPNYAIYLAEKNTLPVKSFNELLRGIPANEKANFSRDKAERFYQEYQQNYVDDSAVLTQLGKEIDGRNILLIANGSSVVQLQNDIQNYIKANNPIVMAVNFAEAQFPIDYVFCGNARRYNKIEGKTTAKLIMTSNVKTSDDKAFVLNYSSLMSVTPAISNNSGLMALRLLMTLGVKHIAVAGMDGYKEQQDGRQLSVQELEKTEVLDNHTINELMSKELSEINKTMRIEFITPTLYTLYE